MRPQLPLALLLASSAAACVDPGAASSDSTSQVTSNLELANGGETTADEAPMFGDELAFDNASIESDAQVTDPMATDASVTALASSTTAVSRRVLVMWGRMPADPNGTARRWSGSLALSRGALIVNRTVGFEPATDRLLPRTARESVAFDSVTRPASDGLALRVIDPDPSAGALTLTYVSAPAAGSAIPSVTYSFDLEQLASGPISIDAGDGNRMIAIALPDRDGCEHGFMRGRWHALSANLGVYRGVVLDADGAPIGHVRGIYGQRRNGDKVMFGKFIVRDGQFKGVLAGTYANGDFDARWIARDGDHGHAEGKYVESADARGGGFVARWADSACQ
jgi:hypothetical protein